MDSERPGRRRAAGSRLTCRSPSRNCGMCALTPLPAHAVCLFVVLNPFFREIGINLRSTKPCPSLCNKTCTSRCLDSGTYHLPPAATMLCDVTVCAVLQCGIQPCQHPAPAQPLPRVRKSQVNRRCFLLLLPILPSSSSFFNYLIIMVHYIDHFSNALKRPCCRTPSRGLTSTGART
jgi:hypothetical protein